ncbi:MAG: hypothetical protein ACRBI6_03025 [Acidimicrobiales bacterium]
MTPPRKDKMSDEHKAALAQGRAEGRAVRLYLEALETHKPKRGRKRTPESIAKRIDKIDLEIPEADPLKRLQLTQERMDLEEEALSLDAGNNLEELEGEFIEVAASYAERKSISYAAFRELGVPAATLRAAGVARSA